MTTIEQIKRLISNGETEKALALLLEYAKEKGGDTEQQALLLSGQFKQWKRSNVIGVEQSKSDLRRIEFGILQALEGQQISSSVKANMGTPSPQKSMIPIIAIAFGVIGIVIAAWSFMNKESSDHEHTTNHESVPTELKNKPKEEGSTLIPATTPKKKNQPKVVPPVDNMTPAFKYKTVDLAGKTWMAENLNENVSNSLCFQDDTYNCSIEGRLYTWASAQKACAALGNGWRLPTGDDWKQLTRMYGGAYADLNYNGKNAYQQLSKGGSTGFNGSFGGKRIFFQDQQTFYYYDFGTIGYYWADEVKRDDPAQARMFTFRSSDNMLLYESIPNTDFISCRCVK